MATEMHSSETVDKPVSKRCTVLLQSLNQSSRRNARSRTLMALVLGVLILGTGAAQGQPAGPPPPPRPGAPPPPPPPPPADPMMATQEGAGAAIQHAYDAIGRSGVLVEPSRAEGSGDLLAQSRDT